MKRTLTMLFAGAVMASLSSIAAARDNISFSISIGTPAYAHVPTVVYHAPPPVYYAPPPVHYYPAPVVRVVAPPPPYIVYYDDDRRHGHKRWKQKHDRRWHR